MSETSNAAKTNDPLMAVADAMQSAVDKTKQGARQAQRSASDALPAASRFAARFVYTTCYTISYGVVFPTAFVAQSIPKNNALVQGFIDGAHAARDKVDHLVDGSQPADAKLPPTPNAATNPTA